MMGTERDRIVYLERELATLKMRYAEAMGVLSRYDTIASKLPLKWGGMKVRGLEEWVDQMLTTAQPPHTVTWTTERPTQPGWYWYRGAHFVEPHALVELVKKEGSESTVEMWHIASEAGHPLPDGEWAGPLEPPQ